MAEKGSTAIRSDPVDHVVVRAQARALAPAARVEQRQALALPRHEHDAGTRSRPADFAVCGTLPEPVPAAFIERDQTRIVLRARRLARDEDAAGIIRGAEIRA